MTRWNPVRELEDFQNRILSAFRPQGSRFGNGEDGQQSLADWSPTVNISEDEKEYLIDAELPEVKREDVNVTVNNGILSISGERKFERDDQGKKHHLIERSYGRFVRSFSLPGDCDSGQVQAHFKDGLLRVKIAKSEAAKPKQIEVRDGMSQ